MIWDPTFGCEFAYFLKSSVLIFLLEILSLLYMSMRGWMVIMNWHLDTCTTFMFLAFVLNGHFLVPKFNNMFNF